MLLVYLTISLAIIYFILIIYYWSSWKQIPAFAVSSSFAPQTRISVIIPARNEEDHISDCIQSLALQSYPHHLWEAVIVDDYSTDRTPEIIQSAALSNISVISMRQADQDKRMGPAHKKRAIETGIKYSTGQLIVTSDADCVFPIHWLFTIASYYETTEASFIAAPVAFTREHTWMEIFQSLDFLSLQGITGASVYKKFHTMCNGANLAYEKKAFEQAGGFSGIDHIASGDDLLLMYKIYLLDPSRVYYLKAKDAIVQTQPAGTIREFFHQRIRWASKAGQYQDKRISTVLLLVFLFNLSLLLVGLFCIFDPGILPWLVSIILVKTIIELFFLFPVAKFFNKIPLLWFFLPAQPVHILYTVIAAFAGQFTTYQWKGRKLK